MLATCMDETLYGVMKMTKKMAEFLHDESGATAVEYGLIAALVSVAGITALTLMGSSLTNIFTTVGTLIGDAAANGNSS